MIAQVHSARRQEEGSSKRYIKLQSQRFKHQKFQFRIQQLAFSVREVVYRKIIQFDSNGDLQFQPDEIREFLIKVLKEDETEIPYFVKNVFRYDYNNDGVIQYDELVNFCMEQHLGEIAIQRLHRQNCYARGAQRLMNTEEFIKTIAYALSFIQFKPNSSHLDSLFKSVDLDCDGFISYEDYFRFLKEYFGSKSWAAGLVNTASVKEEMAHPDKKELDIVRKYSKYQKGEGTGNSQVAPKPTPSNASKNNIINGIGKSSENGNNFQNNAGGMRGSSISINEAKTFENSNVSIRDADSRNQSAEKKKNLLNNQGGIQVTIGKQPIKTPKSEDIALNQLESGISNKIARIVLTQLKNLLMNYDTNKVLRLSYEEIMKFFKIGLKFSQTQLAAITKRGNLSKEKKYTYEQASKLVINQYSARIFSEINVQPTKTVPIQEFVGIFDKICSIVPNTPMIDRFQQLYRSRVTKGANIDYNDFQQLVAFIFNEQVFKH